MKIDDLNPADKIACILAMLCRELEQDIEPAELEKIKDLSVTIRQQEEALVHNLSSYALTVLDSGEDKLRAHKESYEREAAKLEEQLQEHPNSSLLTTFSFLCAYVNRALTSPQENTAISFQP